MTNDVAPVVSEAAAWLAAQPEPIPHAVPVLKERFRLSGLQACQAIALARNAPAPAVAEASTTEKPAEGGCRATCTIDPLAT